MTIEMGGELEQRLLCELDLESQPENDSNHNFIGHSKPTRKVPIERGRISISRMRTSRWAQLLTQRDELMRLLSALFYALASFLIIVINKLVLTSYK